MERFKYKIVFRDIKLTLYGLLTNLTEFSLIALRIFKTCGLLHVFYQLMNIFGKHTDYLVIWVFLFSTYYVAQSVHFRGNWFL